MELIKKIKQAEAQAQEIIEQAKVEASGQAEKGRESRQKTMAKAEQERKKAIEASVSAASEQGRKEVESLKAQAEEQRRQLRDKTRNKMAAATNRVMEYLKD